MSHIFYLICIILLALNLSFISNAAEGTELKTASYKLQMPVGNWQQRNGLYGISSAIFAKEPQKKDLEYLDNIIVQEIALTNRSREEFEKDFFSKLLKIKGFKLIEKVTDKDKDLIKLNYLHNETDTPLRTLSYLYFAKDKLYIVSCSSLAILYEKNKAIYEETCESFKLL